MSTTTGTTQPIVPRDFGDYLAANYGPVPPDSTKTCSGCGNPVAIARESNGNVYCRGCLRYSFGCDTTEEEMVRSIIGAAISAALAAGASEQLVRAAIADAMREAVHVDGPFIACAGWGEDR